MQKIICFSLLSLTGIAFGAGKPMSLNVFQNYITNGDFRKTSGDDKICPSGDIQWIENGTTLKFGGAQPVLLYAFNDKQKNDVSSQKEKCVSEVTNSISDTGSEQKPAATVEQTMITDCGKNQNTTKYTMVVNKLKNKSTVDLKIKVAHKNKQSGKSFLTNCSYEKTDIK